MVLLALLKNDFASAHGMCAEAIFFGSGEDYCNLLTTCLICSPNPIV